MSYDIRDLFGDYNWSPRIEDFGPLKACHSARLNEHFGYMLESFDKEYLKQGGVLKSSAHYEDRMNFARLTASGLIEQVKTKPNDPFIWYDSVTNARCRNLGVNIEVRSITRWDGRDPKILGISRDFEKDFIPN